MASNTPHCDSCSEEGKTKAAIRFCSDCEEALCKECVEYHKKCKATKSHHLMDLASIAKFKISTTKKFCEIHENVSLDFYCTHHDTLCCRVCIPSKHQSCKDVLPLEVVSEHIKKSSLFEDTFSEWQHIAKTLDNFRQDRNENINELEKSESGISEEVKIWKKHLIKQINNFEEKLYIDLSNCKKKNIDQLKKECSKILELHDNVQERVHELKFLNEHGSNIQLYLKLREQGEEFHDVVKRVHEMTMSYKRVYIKFEERSEMDVTSMGSISECKEACEFPYSPTNLQQAQVKPEKVESILTFKKEITKQLHITDKLLIIDIAVTADNTLFLCNNRHGVRKVYVYRTELSGLAYITTLSPSSEPYGISILTGTDKAFIISPWRNRVEVVNTKNLTFYKTIIVDGTYHSISTSGEYFAVGGNREIKIFKQTGEKFTCIRNIALKDQLQQFNVVRALFYDHNDGSIIYRGNGLVSRIELDESVAYRYELSGEGGLAVDSQGYVYVSDKEKSEIHRLLPDGRFRDVILTEKDGIKDAFAIAFNDSFTKFYVTNTTGLVLIYNCQ